LKSISGVVLADIDNDDRGDEPLVGVIVELRDHHGNVTATTTTDYTGAFTFKDVVPGKYTVVEKNPTGHTGVTANTIPVNVFASTVISHYSGDKVGLCSTKNWGVEFVSSSFDPSVNETSFVYQVRNTGGNVTSKGMDISGVTIGWQGRCCVKDASYFGNFITGANPDVSGVSGLWFDSSWQEWERSTGTALDRSSGEVYSITYSGHHDVVPGASMVSIQGADSFCLYSVAGPDCRLCPRSYSQRSSCSVRSSTVRSSIIYSWGMDNNLVRPLKHRLV